MLRVPIDFRDNATRALFPRQLIVYEEKSNEWATCTDPKILVNIDYLAVSYCQTDFADKVALENLVRFTCQILQLRAYWLDFACIGQTSEEKNRDLYRIADVFRGAKKTVIMISGDDDSPLSAGWLTWGDQISALPEALLSHELFYKAGSRFLKPVTLRRLANLAYKDRHDEMMLIDGYSGKDPLPLQEKVELLWKAIRKRSSGNSVPGVVGKKSGIFRAYAAERVYALMGFMQYRIVPDLNESEEAAFIRLMQANKLGGCAFSWGAVIPLPEASKTDDSNAAAVGVESNLSEQTSSEQPLVTPNISSKIIDSPRQHVEQSNCYEGHNPITPPHIFNADIDWEPSNKTAKTQSTFTCLNEANNAASMFLAWTGSKDLDMTKEKFNRNASGSSLNYYSYGRSKLAMFSKSHRIADLSQMVYYFKNAVEHSKAEDTHLIRYHIEWGRASLMQFFHVKNKNVDLTQAIDSAKEVISLCGSRGCPAFFEHYLLTLYRMRYKKLGNVDDLYQAIQIGEKLLLVTTNNDPEIVRYQYNLASTFYHLFLNTEDIEHLNCALGYSKKALQLPNDGNTEFNFRPGTRPLHCALHATLLKLCFDKFGDMNDLDRAITFEEEALRLATENYYNNSSFLYNLASMLCQRYEQSSNIHNLNEAITILEKALRILPDDRTEKAAFQTYLASSFKARYSRLGDLSDLDLSIACHEDALRLIQLRETDDPNAFLAPLLKHLSPADAQRMIRPNGNRVTYKPLYLHNLAITLRIRFEETENLIDIDQAIQNDSEAIRLTPDSGSDKDKACFHDHLGFVYRARFERSHDLDDLDQAISNRQEAVRSIGDNHPHKPIYLDNLAIALGYRFVQMGKINRLDIDRAISSLTEALRRTKNDDLRRIKYLDDLARLLEARFDKYRERKDLEEVIARRRDIVGLSQDGQLDSVNNVIYSEELQKSLEKLNQFQ